MRSPWRLYSIIAIALMIMGCGFHLRGSVEMPRWLNNVAIIVEQAHPELAPLLKSQLQAYTIHVNDNDDRATYWLIIERDRFQQNIAGISSSTTPRQYQLVYTVWFKLQRAKNMEPTPSNQIMVTRQATINSDRILGSTNEEDQLKSEMRRDAVIQLLNRLSRQSKPPRPINVKQP